MCIIEGSCGNHTEDAFHSVSGVLRGYTGLHISVLTSHLEVGLRKHIQWHEKGVPLVKISVAMNC